MSDSNDVSRGQISSATGRTMRHRAQQATTSIEREVFVFSEASVVRSVPARAATHFAMVRAIAGRQLWAIGPTTFPIVVRDGLWMP